MATFFKIFIKFSLSIFDFEQLQIPHFVNIPQLEEQFFGGSAIFGAMVRPLLLNCRHSSTSPEDLPTSPAPETDLSLEPSELCTRYFIPEIQETKIQIYVKHKKLPLELQKPKMLSMLYHTSSKKTEHTQVYAT